MINKATCPLCGNPDAESIEALGTKVYGCPCVPENKSPGGLGQTPSSGAKGHRHVK